jgi:two-component system phosphate regulon sensor histidine kinase PhoR
MKKKLFTRVFLVILLSLSIVFCSGVLAVHQNSKSITAKRLSVEAELLSCLIETKDDIAHLQNYKNRDEFRITVISENGAVLYESNMGGELENHADREEIIGALTENEKTVERYSDTFGCNMTYYAVRSTLDNGDVIVIRVAVRSSEITSYLTVAIPFLVFILFLSIIISGLLAGRMSAGISERISDIGKSLKSLNNGTYLPIETDSSETEFYSVLCQINDLNEKTHSHIQSEKQEKQKLSVVLDNIAEGIIALDRKNQIVFANNSAFNIFEGGKECVGKSLIYLAPDPSLCEKIENSHEEHQSFEYCTDDKYYIIAVRKISTIEIDPETSRIIVITDVTKEKNTAKEKSDFFANASHELKTPITVMQGLSELLLAKGTLGDAEKKQIERIHKESIRLSDLISDMLKLSNLERREQELNKVKISLASVCEETVNELEELIKEKKIAVSIIGDGIIEIDQKKIYELVSNLITNAVKYNKDGGKLDISIYEKDGKVTLKVCDTGIGIGKEHLPRLCERFYRVDKSRSKKTGGTGLGLAIVKHICALYGAELSIESEVDVGTTVRVVFNS